MVDRLWAALQPGRPAWWTTVSIAAAALVVIGLRPTTIRDADPRTVVLLTPGADRGRVERVRDSLNPGLVVRTNEVAGWPSLPVVRDLGQLVARFPGTESVVVLGWGLEEFQIDGPPVRLSALPVPPPAGIVAAFPPSVPFGTVVHVTGRILPVATPVRVTLNDILGPADSAVTDDRGRFSLAYRPRATGPVELVLKAEDGAITQRVAIEVTDPAPSRVLILDAAPSFELSALRNLMAQGEAAVAHRTTVSRGIFRQEFMNLEDTGTTRITAGLLQRFDLVILDRGTLESLSSRELRSLRRAVSEDGLGLVILHDVRDGSELNREDERFFMDAEWTAFPELEERSVRPRWEDGEGPSSVPLFAQPVVLEERFGHEAVLRDETGGVLAQVVARRAGRVALLARVETVRWLRHGMDDVYAAFWHALLSHVTRDPPWVVRWRPVAIAPYRVDEELVIEGRGDDLPSHVLLSTGGNAADSVFLTGAEETKVAVGRYWPRAAGWHRIETPTGDRMLFVYGADEWRTAVAVRRLDATGRAELRSPELSAPVASQAAVPVPLGWAYGAFLVAVALLWLAEDRRPTLPREQ